MSAGFSVSAGASAGASFTVEKLPGDVTVVFGAIPVTDLTRLMRGMGRGTMVSLFLADQLDAAMVFGPKHAIERLTADPPPPRGRTLTDLAAAQAAGLSHEACSWLRSGQRGESSRALFSYLTGLDVRRGHAGAAYAHPRDSDDFSRCAWLVRSVPEVRDGLPKAAGMSCTWARIVEAWPTLDALIEPAGASYSAHARRECTDRLRLVIAGSQPAKPQAAPAGPRST